MRISRLILLCSVAPMALGMAAPLKAAQASEAEGLDEILVVAQRRSERLLDVPISVTALSVKELEASNVTTTLDLQMVTPGLRLENTGPFVQPAIRGISSTFAASTSETNVATYVDGAYQQSTLSSIYDLPDVESIEVLKGPQGTLFGRNATGGAILINTVNPDLKAVQGSVSARYGNFDTLSLKGYVTAPIVTDKLAVGVTAMYEDSDGWKHNLLKGGKHDMGYDTKLVRGKIRFIPWEGADFTLTGLYSKRNDKGVNFSIYKGGNISRIAAPSLPIASNPWDIANDVGQYLNKTQKAVTLHGDIQVGPGTFSTTTHYDHNEAMRLGDLDNGALPIGSLQFPSYGKNFEQEFLYTTDQLGRFRAVGGLFYYSMVGAATLNVNNNTVVSYYKDKTNAFAGFGDLTYDITDQFSLTGGLRYSTETRHGYYNKVFGTSVQPAYTELGSHTWDAVTPRASLLFKATDHTNIYLTYSKGFTSGLFNSASNQAAPVDPEHVDAFELGLKSSEISSLTFSAAAFYYKYKDLQVSSVSQLPNGTLFTIVNNAAKSKIYGLELNANWKVTHDFDLTVGGTYLHARYDEFTNASVQSAPSLPNYPCAAPSSALGCINSTHLTDVSGYTMLRSPDWSGNLSAHYRMDTDIGPIDANGTVFYSAKVFHDVGDHITQPAYALVNANLSWQPKGSGMRVSIWGKNLTNHAVISSAVQSGNFDAVDYLPPRTYGATVGYKF